MPYRYAEQRQDYSDFASGKVFYNLPGHPAFPIRLSSEIFQRCMEIRQRSGLDAPVRIYDPLCGGAYHLATLAYFHWDQIAEIIASDIDADAIAIAERNLSLLTLDGIERRIHELETLQSQYGKAAHTEALVSAAALKLRLEANLAKRAIPTHIFLADALDGDAIARALAGKKADLVITDIPYGQKSTWQISAPLPDGTAPVSRMLEILAAHLSAQAVVAIATPKRHKFTHPCYEPAGKLSLGLRLVTFLQFHPANPK